MVQTPEKGDSGSKVTPSKMTTPMRISSLGIFLTRKCNFNCIYCSSQTGPDPPDKLTLAELMRLLDEAVELGIKWVIIPGEGEVLLDENLFPFLRYATSKGLRSKLYTNGSLLDEEAARRLFGLGTGVVFKLNSFNPHVQDELNGRPDSHQWVEFQYEEVKRTSVKQIPMGLRLLFDAGYRGRSRPWGRQSLLQLESVITRTNAADILEIARFARALRLDFLVETVIPTRSGGGDFDRFALSHEEERQLYQSLSRILGWRFRFQQRIRCRFETNPFVDVRGDFRFCYGLAGQIGNIRDLPLSVLHRKCQILRRDLALRTPPFTFRRGFRLCAARVAHGIR